MRSGVGWQYELVLFLSAYPTGFENRAVFFYNSFHGVNLEMGE